jgi:hypothetical protein
MRSTLHAAAAGRFETGSIFLESSLIFPFTGMR